MAQEVWVFVSSHPCMKWAFPLTSLISSSPSSSFTHSSSTSSSSCYPSTSPRLSSKIPCATSPRRWGQLTSPSPTQVSWPCFSLGLPVFLTDLGFRWTSYWCWCCCLALQCQSAVRIYIFWWFFALACWFRELGTPWGFLLKGLDLVWTVGRSPVAQWESSSATWAFSSPYFYFFRGCYGRSWKSAAVSVH